jgi:hypothetical protein
MQDDDLHCPRCQSDNLEEVRRPTRVLDGDAERTTAVIGHYKCEDCSWAGDLELPVNLWPENLHVA